MAQYKVPQNVDIEDKVIAGLTLRQFAFLMFAGGIILVLRYVLLGPLKILWIPAALVIASLGVALAFLKVNDRPFEIFLLSAGKTFLRPARRIWRKEVLETAPEAPAVKEQAVQPKENYQDVKNKLERIAMIVDTGGNVPEGENRVHSLGEINKKEDPQGLHDVLEKTEEGSPGLDKLFDEAFKKVKKKKEPPISTLASMPVDKNQYTYDEKLPIKSEEEIQKMVEGANHKVIKNKEEIS